MGFYGNITNTSKTNFVFDKIYTNRKAMDDAQRKIDSNTGQTVGDGVFIGRYVLIEYGQITNDSFIRAYGPKEDGYYHISDDKEEVTRILYTANKNKIEGRYITNGIVIYTITKNNNKDIYNYYECNGGTEDGLPGFANNPGLNPNNDPYFFNFNQDKQKYDTSRGYDGTVWVKTSINNEIKYVNIAELNSVVPSFEMVADAPTMSPILPHFDTASNNVYYKLHWQPAWGMRVAKADNPERSDYKTAWSQEYYKKETGEAYTKWYNPATGKWDSDSPCEIVADIYFNYAAFDSQVGEDTIHGAVKDMNNYIGITADGLSGNEYNLHDGTSKSEQKPDTQQIHINLPAIGNMMSDAWDIIHGKKRDNSTVDSLQGRLNFFKDEIAHNEIPIQSSETEGYLVGSVINGAVSYENSTDATNQDKSVYNENILEVEINSEKQHEHDDAWIATNIDTNQGKDGDKDYHRKAISIHHTFHKRDDSAVDELNINNYDGKSGGSAIDSDTQFQKIINKDTIQLYVPKVDKAGHVVGTDIDKVVLPYGYKHIETIGNKIDNETTDLDTTQDTVSADKGTVTAGTPIGETAIVATETQDTVNIDPFNKWIQVKASDNKIEIAHEIHGIVEKDKTKSDLNNGTDSITIQDIVFDAAGHVTHNRKHEYELPYGFKHFTTNGKVTSTNDLYTTITQVTNDNDTETKATVQDNQKSCVANNTQDTLHISVGNKWIQTAIVNNEDQPDSLTIAHEIHAIKDSDATGTNLNGGNATNIASDNIIIPDLKFDKAGHLTENHSHTYTLPYGYKTFTDGTNSSVANSTQDTFKFIGDSWLKPTISEDQITYTHIGPVNGTDLVATSASPKFKGAFDIITWGFDSLGHKNQKNKQTITLPTLIKEDNDINNTGYNLISNIEFIDDNTQGQKLQVTRKLVGEVPITNYALAEKSEKLSASDTINQAFGKLQAQINALDLAENSSTTQFISKISQVDGKVAVERAAAGTLVLGKENTDYSVLETASAITYSDNLATAFGKVEAQIKAETTARQEEIANLINSAPEALDTLGEVANWINNDETGAAAMANDINGLKTKVGEKTVATQITDKINTLNKDDNAVAGQYVSAVSETNGIINVSRENLPTLSSGTTNGTVKLSNGNDVAVTGLRSAAYTDTSAYIRPNIEFVYDKIQENGVEKELKTTIEEMAKEIASLKQVLKNNGLITE